MTAILIAAVLLLFVRPPKTTPRQRLMLLIFTPLSIYADTLPSRAELFATLRAFHDEAAAVQLTEIDNSKVIEKHNWMNWTPSLGIGYNLQGQPRPTVSYSLSQVKANIDRRAAEAQTQRQREAKKAAILRGGNLAFRTDSFALVALLEKHRILKKSLDWLEAVERVEAEKWEYEKERYEKRQTTAAEFLDIKAAYMRRGLAYFQKLEEVGLLEIEILKSAKF